MQVEARDPATPGRPPPERSRTRRARSPRPRRSPPASSFGTTPSIAGIHSVASMRAVARPEEPLGAGEQVRVVVAPRECAVAAEGARDLLEVDEHRAERRQRPSRRRPGTCRRRSAIAASSRERVRARGRVVLEEPTGGLAVEPLADEARIRAGRRRRPRRRVRGPAPAIARYRPELVAEPDAEAEHRAGHVADHRAHELFELALVHRPLLRRGVAVDLDGRTRCEGRARGEVLTDREPDGPGRRCARVLRSSCGPVATALDPCTTRPGFSLGAQSPANAR